MHHLSLHSNTKFFNSISMSTILQMSLSFSKSLSSTTPLFLHTKLPHLSLHSPPPAPKHSTIRMGGGPRTYPGGVSKWQWKRMQAKKSKQLLKARLCRERQIYEMRKRAELKAAVSELERPWEVVERAPNLFSVGADEQVKVLADRFQKPGGFDMWTEKDGPQLFEAPDGLPSARFFPKGVVHSVKPYGRVAGPTQSEGVVPSVKPYGRIAGPTQSEGSIDREVDSVAENSAGVSGIEKRSGKTNGGKWRKKGNGRNFSGGDSGQVGFDRKQRGEGPPMRRRGGGGRVSRSKGLENVKDLRGEVYDMSLQQDGIYGFQEKNGRFDATSAINEPVFEELDWREMIE